MEGTKYLSVKEREQFNQFLPVMVEVASKMKNAVCEHKKNISLDDTENLVIQFKVVDCISKYIENLILTEKLDEILLEYLRE